MSPPRVAAPVPTEGFPRSLVRARQDFARDAHVASDGDDALQAALEKARSGSMEAVTAAYEQQVSAPMSSLLSGKLLTSLLLLLQQLRLLMEEEVRTPPRR